MRNIFILFIAVFYSTSSLFSQELELIDFEIIKTLQEKLSNIEIKQLYFKDLPSPHDEINDETSNLNIPNPNVPGVYMGEKPENFNGKVLAIHPGLSHRFNGIFIMESGLYKKLYNEGYAVAFFASSGFNGDYYNAKVIAETIDGILDYYNVDKLSLVGLSNGGTAAEIAFTIYGKADKVEKVYAIGTPYFGTELADFASLIPDFILDPILTISNVLISPIMNTTEPNAENDPISIYLSSTSYRSNILRPIVDQHELNRPNDFIVSGSSVFINFETNSFNDFMYNVSMFATGTFLSILSFDIENDGITPFYSSKRPGAKIYPEFEDVEKNHLHITSAGEVTADILIGMLNKNSQDQTNSSISRLRNNGVTTKRGSTYKSNYQLKSNGLVLDSYLNAEATLVTIDTEALSDLKSSYNNMDNTLPNQRLYKTNKEEIFDQIVKKQKISNIFNARISQNKQEDNSSGVQFLVQENINAILDVDFTENSNFDVNSNPYPILKLRIETEQNISLEDVVVTAKAKKLANLIGQVDEDSGKEFDLKFVYNLNKNIFEANTLEQSWGIYSLNISVGDNYFRRDLVVTYTVGTLFNETKLATEDKNTLNNKSSVVLDSKNHKIIISQSSDFVKSTLPIIVKAFDKKGAYLGQITENKDNGGNQLSISTNNISFLSGEIYFLVLEKGNTTEKIKLIAK